jgi:hypothetical protein
MKNRFILGWIFVQQVNLENGHNIWGGTTTELREIAQNLGYVVDLHREDQD